MKIPKKTITITILSLLYIKSSEYSNKKDLATEVNKYLNLSSYIFLLNGRNRKEANNMTAANIIITDIANINNNAL